MISLALDECRKLGIDRVLMVCDKRNIGSAKSIINNGGVLYRVYKVDGKYRMRIIAKCRLNKRSRAMFAQVLSKFSRSGAKGVTVSVDFNPSNI